MPIQKCKPTSPGRRFVEKVVHDHLHKGAPYAPLVEAKKRTGGRNNNGHITTRHVGGGHKQHYRVIDFKRNKEGIPARVERIEYDPNRTAHIALLCYVDGERRYHVPIRVRWRDLDGYGIIRTVRGIGYRFDRHADVRIVHSLVEGDLRGTLRWERSDDGGTRVVLRLPLT